jgi:hypothetical protein
MDSSAIPHIQLGIVGWFALVGAVSVGIVGSAALGLVLYYGIKGLIGGC